MSAVGTTPLPGSGRSALGALSALSVVLIWASWLVSTRHSVGAGLGPSTSVFCVMAFRRSCWRRSGGAPGCFPRGPWDHSA